MLCNVGSTGVKHRPKGSIEIQTGYRTPKIVLLLLVPQNPLKSIPSCKQTSTIVELFFLYIWTIKRNYFFHYENINFYEDTWFFCSCFCCARNSSLSFSTRSCLAILSIRWWFWTVSTYSKRISSTCYCQVQGRN